jgi:hypothetical protein
MRTPKNTMSQSALTRSLDAVAGESGSSRLSRSLEHLGYAKGGEKEIEEGLRLQLHA